MTYPTWRNSVLGKKLGDGQCVAAIRDYWSKLFGVSPYTIAKSVVGAKDLLAAANPKYLQVIKNDHSNVNQLPKAGDVMVFGATPASGYTNRTVNKYGHTGVCDGADSKGYWLVQQNSPHSGSPVNRTYYAWKYRPCLGWLRPIEQAPSLLDKLKAQVSSLTAKLSKEETDLAKLTATNKTLNEAIAKERKAVTDLQTKLDAKTIELAKADDANATLKVEAQAHRVQLKENDKVIASLQAKLQACGETNQPITVRQAVKVLIEAFKAWIK